MRHRPWRHRASEYLELASTLAATPAVAAHVANRIVPGKLVSRWLPICLIHPCAAATDSERHRMQAVIDPELVILANWLQRTSVAPKQLAAYPIERLLRELDRAYDRTIASRAATLAAHEDYRRKMNAGRRHAGRYLCLECRTVNAHAAGCTRDDEFRLELPQSARPPRKDASTSRWRQFARAMGERFQHALGF